MCVSMFTVNTVCKQEDNTHPHTNTHTHTPTHRAVSKARQQEGAAPRTSFILHIPTPEHVGLADATVWEQALSNTYLN